MASPSSMRKMDVSAGSWLGRFTPASALCTKCLFCSSRDEGISSMLACMAKWMESKKEHALTNLIHLPYWASLGNTLREGPLSKECQHSLGTFTCVMQVSVPRVEQKLHTRLRRHHVCDWLRAMNSRLLVAHDVVTHHLRPAQQGSMNQDALRKLHQA